LFICIEGNFTVAANTVELLFAEELKDLLWAEAQIMKTLPKQIKAA
jgi:ferritin-like metal-binding protein YciE